MAFATLACGHSSAAPDGGAPDAVADAEVGYRAEVLDDSQHLTLGERTFRIVLARITRPDGGHSYVEWIPSDKPGPRPAVVMTMPYATTPWSGEPLDTRWASYTPEPDGLYLDHDGPGDPTGAKIYVEHLDALGTAGNATPQLINDFGALLIFGRFYAGGSVREYIADMAAGMWFAAEQPEIDRARIAIWGGSWGGFEALFAARHADPRARPRVVAAMYPPSDFADWVGHATTRTGAAQVFLTPYLRRIYAATGGGPDHPATYDGLRVGDLCDGLPETLALHDEHDDLVPVRETQALVATCHASALYWPRSGPIDPSDATHGPIVAGDAPQAVATYALTFAHLRIATPDQPYLIEFYIASSLVEHLTAVRAAQLTGRDVSDAVPRLRELCDPRIYLVAHCLANDCPTEPGAAVVARTINQVWGTTFTAATIGLQLATGLPP